MVPVYWKGFKKPTLMEYKYLKKKYIKWWNERRMEREQCN